MPDHTLEIAFGESSLGQLVVAQSARGLRALFLGDDREALRHELARRFPGATLVVRADALRAVVEKLVAYLEAPATSLDIPLDPYGTEFQRAVWRALREVPAGETATYAEIAARIGRPTAARAVAQACAANTLAVVIPCHRIVRGDGELSGYRWGVARKRELLAREGARGARREPRALASPERQAGAPVAATSAARN